MRKKKLIYNTISSFVYQIIAIICGFILPRLILKVYNSEVNGLINSITEFLRVISILDLGVGAVICSSLYKPLATKKTEEISKILSSANKYFKKIGYILIIYILILPLLFIFVVDNKFNFIYTATLIFSMSISTIAQYFFGIINQQLLTADQKGYIQYNLQSITLILNTIICSILILNGGSIQLIKLITSIIFLARPIYMQYYVNKHYKINKKIRYEEEPIKQKWNGLFQHLAAVVLDSTDTIVLSLFSNLSNVSIYSIYFLVIHGVRQLIQSITNGVQSLLGDIIAKNEKIKLKKIFSLAEWGIHSLSTVAFGCVLVLLIPFVKIYTHNITDVNYIVPSFSVLITLAHTFYCYRLPYHLIIKAAGKYKETQSNYLIAMILNIVISVLTVKKYGLIGVAIGTLIAMAYQTIWMANYCGKNIVEFTKKSFYKQISINSIILIIGYISTSIFNTNVFNYIDFINLSIKVGINFCIISIIINLIFYKKNIIELLNYRKKN